MTNRYNVHKNVTKISRENLTYLSS